jgi:hypothetical protein
MSAFCKMQFHRIVRVLVRPVLFTLINVLKSFIPLGVNLWSVLMTQMHIKVYKSFLKKYDYLLLLCTLHKINNLR